MKKMLKRLSIVLMMLAMVMGLTACSSEEAEESSVDPMYQVQFEMQCTSVLESLSILTDEDIAMYLESGDDFTIAAMTAWTDNRDELGAFREVISTEIEFEEEKYVLTSDVVFEQKNATVTMNFDETGIPTYMTIEVQYTFGELMSQAGMNTVMGVGIVFLMLLFLSAIISLFKFIGLAVEKSEKKTAPKTAPAATPKATVPVVEENLVDDGELVAVIAAAIAASENTSTDSFVVRSIRRKPNNKWSRA